MKNLFGFTLLLLFLAGTYSCQKDAAINSQEEAQKIGTQVYPIAENLVYQADLESHHVEKAQIRVTIENFFEETQYRNTMTVSEGVWMVETGLNYLQGNARANYKFLETNNYYYYLAANGSTQLSNSEVNSVINSIETQVIQDENTAVTSCVNGKTVFVDIAPYTNSRGEVIVRASIGTGVNADPICINGNQLELSLDDCSFVNQTGEWKYRDDENLTCADERTAPEALMALLNYNDENWPCPLNSGMEETGFFTEITFPKELFHEDFPNPNDDNSGDGYRDFLIYFSSENASHSEAPLFCFEPDDMNFYYNGIRQAILQDIATFYPEKEFVDVPFLKGDILFGGASSDLYIHFVDYRAGIFME